MLKQINIQTQALEAALMKARLGDSTEAETGQMMIFISASFRRMEIIRDDVESRARVVADDIAQHGSVQ